MNNQKNGFHSLEEKMTERYRNSIRIYFADQTEEGQIFKSARMEEDEYVLEHIFGVPHDDIHGIYREEYWKKYGKGGKTL